jgi:hypothetical protein
MRGVLQRRIDRLAGLTAGMPLAVTAAELKYSNERRT